MAADVIGDVLNSVIHQVMRNVAVVQVSPRAEHRERPRCLGSGLQGLIRSRVPSRTGPTPRQILPAWTLWQHSRASARWSYQPVNISIGDEFAVLLKEISDVLPQTAFENALRRYRTRPPRTCSGGEVRASCR